MYQGFRFFRLSEDSFWEMGPNVWAGIMRGFQTVEKPKKGG